MTKDTYKFITQESPYYDTYILLKRNRKVAGVIYSTDTDNSYYADKPFAYYIGKPSDRTHLVHYGNTIEECKKNLLETIKSFYNILQPNTTIVL